MDNKNYGVLFHLMKIMEKDEERSRNIEISDLKYEVEFHQKSIEQQQRLNAHLKSEKVALIEKQRLAREQ